MTTYTIAIKHIPGGPCEAKAYSTASNAIDDMECWRAGGATVSAILCDGKPIYEAQLWAEEGAGQTIVIDLGTCE